MSEDILHREGQVPVCAGADNVTLAPTVQIKNLDDFQEQFLDCLQSRDLCYLRAGQLLLAAKAKFGPHGYWLNWVKDEAGMAPYRAQRLMRTAEYFSNTTLASHLSFTQAYILTRIPEKHFNDFINSERDIGNGIKKPVVEMTTKQLEKAVSIYVQGLGLQKPKRQKELVATGSSGPSLDSRIEGIKVGIQEVIVLLEDEKDSGQRDRLISQLGNVLDEAIGQLPQE